MSIKQIDYSKSDLSAAVPSYQLSKILPLSGSQTATVSAAGGAEMLFEIPGVKVVNLSRSYLNFTITPIAGTHYNYIQALGIPIIRQIQLYTRGGLYLCDLNEAANYTCITELSETKLQDFLSKDKFADGSGASDGSKRSDVLAADTIRTHLDAARGSINYTEPSYVVVGADTTATPILTYKYSLSNFKNTILGLDKDLLFNEILILRVVFQGANKVGWNATTATAPVTGAAALASYEITNSCVYIAVEQNPVIISESIAKRNSVEGMNLLFPYVYTNKQSLNGTSQSVTLRFNRGNGMKLQKIYHSLFAGTETLNNIYDHHNLPDVTGPPAVVRKVKQFYTMLDNNRLQQFNLSAAALDDYLLMKDKLKGSVIQSSNIYQYNWFWLEDFTVPSNMIDNDVNGVESDNIVQGLDLSQERKWDFFGVQTANASYNHYSFSVCQKLLVMNQAGILVM